MPLELPEQWLWDIIDEFIYQFQSFCVWRSKVKSKTDEELMLLVDGSQVRCASCVLNRAINPLIFVGLEFVQCTERPVLAHPKVAD